MGAATGTVIVALNVLLFIIKSKRNMSGGGGGGGVGFRKDQWRKKCVHLSLTEINIV